MSAQDNLQGAEIPETLWQFQKNYISEIGVDVDAPPAKPDW